MTTPADNRPLRVTQVAELPPEADRPAWLVESLWARQAVGVLGGAPKCCKTYLALEIALAVASGTPCLGHFPVPDPGPVLLFAAEDAPQQVHARLRGLAQARGVDFAALPIFLILAEQLRLDLEHDQQRLAETVEQHLPRLLILDPFVRLHRLDENSAREISSLLAALRALQRRHALAVLLVHHTRKNNGQTSGQDLRGSGDLHAWGDSNLYLRKANDQLRLTVEHRAACAPEPIALTLTGDQPHLHVDASPMAPRNADLGQQVLDVIGRHPDPLTQTQLRAILKVRNQSLTVSLRTLLDQHKISHSNHGWVLNT
jgi:hypothetical protein